MLWLFANEIDLCEMFESNVKDYLNRTAMSQLASEPNKLGNQFERELHNDNEWAKWKKNIWANLFLY